MRPFGRAWLEMRATETAPARSRYTQRAVFLPRGLAGHAYWAAVWPFHAIVLGGMAVKDSATSRSPALAAVLKTDPIQLYGPHTVPGHRRRSGPVVTR